MANSFYQSNEEVLKRVVSALKQSKRSLKSDELARITHRNVPEILGIVLDQANKEIIEMEINKYNECISQPAYRLRQEA